MRILTRLWQSDILHYAVAAVILAYAMASGAQTVALPATGVTLIGAEGITITATTGSGVIYYFGAGTTYNKVTTLKLPAPVSCSSASSAGCVALGGDPAPGVAKSIYAVQQATAYTVTTSASKTPIPVPALTPPPVVTPPVNSVTMSLTNLTFTVGGTTYTINAGCSATPTVQ